MRSLFRSVMVPLLALCSIIVVLALPDQLSAQAAVTAAVSEYSPALSLGLIAAVGLVSIELTTPHWDSRKRLYRPGKHDVSPETAEELGFPQTKKAKQAAQTQTTNQTSKAGDSTSTAGGGGRDSGADATAGSATDSGAGADAGSNGDAQADGDATEGVSSGEGGTADVIPEDFPGAKALQAAGVTTLTQVRGMDEKALVDLKDIGTATAARIIEAAKASGGS